MSEKTPEERLAKLEKWAITTGTVLNKIQKENVALKAKLETLESTLGKAAMMTEQQKSEHHRDQILNDVFGAHECKACKKRINLKKEDGHWCKAISRWVDHSKVKVD